MFPSMQAMLEQIEALLTEQEKVSTSKREIVEALNQVLPRLGYRVVSENADRKPLAATGKRRKQTRSSPGKAA